MHVNDADVLTFISSPLIHGTVAVGHIFAYSIRGGKAPVYGDSYISSDGNADRPVSNNPTHSDRISYN